MQHATADAHDHDLPGWWHGQCGQDHTIADIFADSTHAPRFGARSSHYFVDLAANHPIRLSNTRALERDFSWRGLCIDANRQMVDLLAARRDCKAVLSIVSDAEEGAVALHGSTGHASVQSGCSAGDAAAGHCQRSRTLAGLLREHRAPSVIAYLSLDVEGHEEAVLRNFPFGEWTFLAMTVERPGKALTQELSRHGYHHILNHGWFGDELWLHESIPGGMLRAGRRANASYTTWRRAMLSPNWVRSRSGNSGSRLRSNNCGIPAAWVEPPGPPPVNLTHLEVLDRGPPCSCRGICAG